MLLRTTVLILALAILLPQQVIAATFTLPNEAYGPRPRFETDTLSRGLTSFRGSLIGECAFSQGVQLCFGDQYRAVIRFSIDPSDLISSITVETTDYQVSGFSFDTNGGQRRVDLFSLSVLNRGLQRRELFGKGEIFSVNIERFDVDQRDRDVVLSLDSPASQSTIPRDARRPGTYDFDFSVDVEVSRIPLSEIPIPSSAFLLLSSVFLYGLVAFKRMYKGYLFRLSSGRSPHPVR